MAARLPSRLKIRSPHQDHRYRAPDQLRLTKAEPLRLLLVGSCLVDSLALTLRQYGSQVEVLTFNNVAALPEKSEEALSAFDLHVIQIPFRSIVFDHVYIKLAWDDIAGHEAHFSHAVVMLAQMLHAALAYHRQSGIATVISNFMVPQQNPMGRLLPRYDLRNPVHFVESIIKKSLLIRSSQGGRRHGIVCG